MLIIKGVNIFPNDIEALVRGDDRHTGEYRLVVDRFEHCEVLDLHLCQRIKPTELIMAWARP
jgi:phenylacetate-coenzyme A ligase PaaK-like adenylate-forming protein